MRHDPGLVSSPPAGYKLEVERSGYSLSLYRHRLRRAKPLGKITPRQPGAIRDLQAARPWYERLLGEPTFFPHTTEAAWTLADDRSVYIVEQADAAGNSVVTMFVDDLDAQVAAIAARGLEPDERLTYSNGVRKALYRDPDGNELGFGGAPLDTGS
jgi:hypothetical protein